MADNLTYSPGYTLRPFTLQDADETVALFNNIAVARLGHPDTNLQENLVEWKTPGFDLQDCTRVLVNPEGKIVGYVEVWDVDAPHVLKYCWFELHPDHWRDPLALWLLDWAEETARKRIHLSPEGTKVFLREGINAINKDHDRILTQAGFNVVRVFKRMVIEMDGLPIPPVIPKGIKIRPIIYSQEFDAAILAIDEAFQDHWGYVRKSEEDILKSWHHRLEEDHEFDPSLWFLAMDGEQVAGACLCMPKLAEDPSMGWIAELAVRRPWRKKGLGLALLRHAFFAFYKYGQIKVGLTVDSDSLTDATRLYTNAGMQVVRQHDVYQKELRPGKDLSTQEI